MAEKTLMPQNPSPTSIEEMIPSVEEKFMQVEEKEAKALTLEIEDTELPKKLPVTPKIDVS